MQVCCPPVIVALLWCRSALLGQSSNAATTTKRLTLLLLEVTLPSIATSLVQMLVCDSFDDGSSYLRADLTLSCDGSNRRVQSVVFALILLAIYSLGGAIV